MKRVLFITNIPSPYRVQFFDTLGKTMDITVLYSDRKGQHGRDSSWFVSGEGYFRGVQLEKQVFAKGENSLCLDVISWLKQDFDHIVVCGYSSPTVILAMAWLKLHAKPFWMEVDGGIIRPDSRLKHQIKKLFVSAPTGWISSGKHTTAYLVHYGAKREAVREYPFSSLQEADIASRIPSPEEKAQLRRELGIREEKMVLTVGQFIHRKGFDILMSAARQLSKDTAVCIIGGEPTQEYLKLREELGLTNTYFIPFRKKQELARYYRAADLFVLPTREDIWGLVVNEAMAYGLPVITTDRCVAGLELVEEGINGHIVPVEDAAALADAIRSVLQGDREAMGRASLQAIAPYTIENMARVHQDIFS